MSTLEHITPPTLLTSQLPSKLEPLLFLRPDVGILQNEVVDSVDHGGHQELSITPAHHVQGLS